MMVNGHSRKKDISLDFSTGLSFNYVIGFSSTGSGSFLDYKFDFIRFDSIINRIKAQNCFTVQDLNSP